MGAWDFGNFQNDDALDWVFDLIEEDTIDFISETLKVIVGNEMDSQEIYIEAPDASEALAAAETVAALKGKPSNDIPEDLVEWVREKKNINLNNLPVLAKEAVKKIKEESELKELWEETDSYNEWVLVLNNLEERLN